MSDARRRSTSPHAAIRSGSARPVATARRYLKSCPLSIEGENGSWIEVQRLDAVTWRCPPLAGGQQVYVVQRYKQFSDG